MAIDDNASYELTGYQVKDLAQKIRAKADSNSLASVATSGLYSDLTGAPTIPTVYNGTLTIQQNGTQLGTFSANQSSDTTINITGGGGTTYTAGNGISIDSNNEISIDDTVVAEVSDLPTDFTGATSSVAGAHGLVPAPAAGDEGKALHGDGTWKDTTAKLVEMSYGESNAWAKFIAAYNAGSIVYCRASSAANPATGSQTRKAFMAYVNNETTPTNVEFQYVRSQSSKTDSQQTDQVFVYTLTNASGGTWSVASRNMGPKIVAGTGMSSTFTTGANATITLNAEPNYSTSEVDTKVKWVDGSTIYRKTINFGALPDSSAKTVAHNISNIANIIKVEGWAKATTGVMAVLPFVSTVGLANGIQVVYDATDITVTTGTDRTNFTTCYITLYYTKSS